MYTKTLFCTGRGSTLSKHCILCFSNINYVLTREARRTTTLSFESEQLTNEKTEKYFCFMVVSLNYCNVTVKLIWCHVINT
jgi:hypothetical protein